MKKIKKKTSRPFAKTKPTGNFELPVEAKYRSLLDAMIEPVYICNPDFTIHFMNQPMIDRLGKDATGQKCFKAIHGHSSPCPGCVMPIIQKNKKITREIWSPLDQKTYFTSHSPIPLGNGKFAKMAIFRDITELDNKVNERTRELIKARDKAQESDKIKSAFLQNISHEIRTPLNAIKGFTFLLEKNTMDESMKKEYFSIINKNIKLLLNHFQDIIDISKLEAETTGIENEPFAVNRLMRDLFDRYLNIINQEQKEVELILSLGNNDPSYQIASDEVKLKQIMVHLLNNAVKFTSTGYIEFGYILEGQKLRFYVKDTGKGIREEKINQIFELFEKDIDKSSTFYTGVGIGLTIAKKLVDALEGDIKVFSEPGEGSTFYVSIPFSVPGDDNGDNLGKKTTLTVEE